MSEQRSCFRHGAFDEVRCPACADEAYEAALATGNREALAVEIESRLRASHNCYGTSFKREPNGPCVWTKPLWLERTEPPWRQWAEEAAAVLIGGAR